MFCSVVDEGVLVLVIVINAIVVVLLVVIDYIIVGWDVQIICVLNPTKFDNMQLFNKQDEFTTFI